MGQLYIKLPTPAAIHASLDRSSRMITYKLASPESTRCGVEGTIESVWRHFIICGVLRYMPVICVNAFLVIARVSAFRLRPAGAIPAKTGS